MFLPRFKASTWILFQVIVCHVVVKWEDIFPCILGDVYTALNCFKSHNEEHHFFPPPESSSCCFEGNESLHKERLGAIPPRFLAIHTFRERENISNQTGSSQQSSTQKYGKGSGICKEGIPQEGILDGVSHPLLEDQELQTVEDTGQKQKPSLQAGG